MLSVAAPGEPDWNTTEGKRYWRERQDALNTNWIADDLTPHEVVFYEQFSAVGNRFELIPRNVDIPGKLTPSANDFRWFDRDVLVELKSFEKPRQNNVSVRIRRTVLKARARGVVKNNFIVYSRRYPPTAGFLNQMRLYNVLHPDAQIEQLFWWPGDSLMQIDLQ